MQKEIEQGNDSFSPRILYALRAERIVITTSLLSCSELYVRPLLLFLFAPGSEGIAFEVFFIYVDGEQGGTVKRELGRKGIILCFGFVAIVSSFPSVLKNSLIILQKNIFFVCLTFAPFFYPSHKQYAIFFSMEPPHGFFQLNNMLTL